MTLGEIAWDLGDWAAARRRLPPGDRRHVGITFAYVELKRAEVALADADHEAARASLNRVADLVMGSREPQFIGLAGALRGELPERAARPGDSADLRALAMALPRCRWVTCDATMADVVRRTRLDLRYRTELFTGRRADVDRLRERLLALD